MKRTLKQRGSEGSKEHRQAAIFTPRATDVHMVSGHVIASMQLDSGITFRFEFTEARALELSSQLEAAAQRVRG